MALIEKVDSKSNGKSGLNSGNNDVYERVPNKIIKVLVCDNMAFMQVALWELIESAEDFKVVDIARNSEEVVEKAIRLRPDAITMELNILIMNGLTVLNDLVGLEIAPVIVISTNVVDEQLKNDILKAGAYEFLSITDDINKSERLSEALINNLRKSVSTDFYDNRHQRESIITKYLDNSPNVKFSSDCLPYSEINFKAVVIGLSTGGPQALYKVLPNLPADLNAAVFVVQHMPVAFISTFTQSLARKTKMKCVESADGLKIEPCKIYIATGGSHLTLVQSCESDIRIHQSREPQNIFMPSVDITMHSVCNIFLGNTIGVLMTGKGQDGVEAMVRIANTGGVTIVESEATAVDFSMPREVIRNGGAMKIVPNWNIAAEIIDAIKNNSDSNGSLKKVK